MQIDASFFMRGDIVCFDRAPWCSNATFIQGVQVVEAVVHNALALATAELLSQYTLSSIAVHHVAIVTDQGIGATYADATGDQGIRARPIANIRRAHLRVYRMKAPYQATAREAADVAVRWSNRSKGGYSNARAIAASIRPSFYGPLAANLADHYHNHRNTAGGPPGLLVGKGTDMFCTTFVIACYQAALGWWRSAQFMGRDATNCLPATLSAYLSSCDDVWDDFDGLELVNDPAPVVVHGAGAAPTAPTVATAAAMPAAPLLPAPPLPRAMRTATVMPAPSAPSQLAPPRTPAHAVSIVPGPPMTATAGANPGGASPGQGQLAPPRPPSRTAW